MRFYTLNINFFKEKVIAYKHSVCEVNWKFSFFFIWWQAKKEGKRKNKNEIMTENKSKEEESGMVLDVTE